MKTNKTVALGLRTIIATTSLFLTSDIFSDDEPWHVKEMEDVAFALPMQAHLCEVAGVGNVTGVTTNGFMINVDTWWWNENSVTNPLHVAVKKNVLVPTNVPIAFLASTGRYGRGEIKSMSRLDTIYMLMFKPEKIIGYTNIMQRGGLRLLDDKRSWFRTDEEDGKLLAYTSNLVHYAKVESSFWEFYTVMRNSAGESGMGTKVYTNTFWADTQMAGFFSNEVAARVMLANFQDSAGPMGDMEYIHRFGTNNIPVLPLSPQQE